MVRSRSDTLFGHVRVMSRGLDGDGNGSKTLTVLYDFKKFNNALFNFENKNN